MVVKKEYYLLNNSRFYILVSSFLISSAVVAYLRLDISNDQVFYIRLQQVFGLLSVLYWYFALTISPIGHAIGKYRIRKVEFARRAIGVSAFYFALLHSTVALFGQLGGFDRLVYLPSLFKWSLLGGLGALIILFLLTITSLDRVVKFMTFPRWKLLHRLIYLGGVLAVLHIWTIGTHLAYGGVQTIAFIGLVILFGLELYRFIKLVNDRHLRFGRSEMVMTFIATWTIAVTLILAMPYYIKNYHSRHNHNSNSSNNLQHRGH